MASRNDNLNAVQIIVIVLASMLLVALVFGLLGGLVLGGVFQPDDLREAKTQLAIERVQALELPFRLLWLGAGVVILYCLAGIATNIVRKMGRWASTVNPTDGLFGVQIMHLGNSLVVLDPNRSAGAITILENADGRVMIEQPGAGHPAQTAITTAALQVQALAATTPPSTYHDKRTVTLGSPTIGPTPAELPGVTLPDVVNLRDLLHGTPRLDRLVLGAAVTPSTGKVEPVTESLHRLMHVLAVGASGWGKSTWLRSFLYQLALTTDPVGVVAIDCYGSEFNPLVDWGKLLYPVARTPGQATAALQAVTGEIERRKELYEALPLATKLNEYNTMASEPLMPWVVVADESTALLAHKGLGDPLRQVVQTARQYGIYVLLAGQSAKHSVIDTQTRDNFSSRLAFRTSPTSSRVVLDDKGASDLSIPGRGLLVLPGREMTEMQTGFVSREQFYAALTGDGPAMELPDVADDDDTSERVLMLYEEGLTPTQIADNVFGYKNGRMVARVQAIIDEYESGDSDGDSDSDG